MSMRCLQVTFRFMPICSCMVRSQITLPAGAVVRLQQQRRAELHTRTISSYCCGRSQRLRIVVLRQDSRFGTAQVTVCQWDGTARRLPWRRKATEDRPFSVAAVRIPPQCLELLLSDGRQL